MACEMCRVKAGWSGKEPRLAESCEHQAFISGSASWVCVPKLKVLRLRGGILAQTHDAGRCHDLLWMWGGPIPSLFTTPPFVTYLVYVPSSPLRSLSSCLGW